MPLAPDSSWLEEQIARWRTYLLHRRTIDSTDAAELEDHLREQVSALLEAGLAPDEAFLVAVKRMGDLDAVAREFAREHSDRLWKQLVFVPSAAPEGGSRAGKEAVAALALAVAAAMAVKLPALFGLGLDSHSGFYLRNASLFVLPFLAGYFAWKRSLPPRTLQTLGALFVAAAVLANLYPFQGPQSHTEILVAIHLPIALWLVVGVAYAGPRWRDPAGRMDFIRFSGEIFIYYVLIALGGGVLTGFSVMIFESIGLKIEPFVEEWLIPCGAAGAVLVAAWLVEAKQSVIENMAPVLTRLFTPLFAAVLLVFLGTLAWTGRGLEIQRDVLIGFDLLLVVVLGLLLYSASARDPKAPPGWFDTLQVVLVLSALAVDAVALWAIVGRISEFGFTPNRVAALGENLILLGNLSWSAVLYLRFLVGRGPFWALEAWQTRYLPVYGAWAVFVVGVFPPLFGYR